MSFLTSSIQSGWKAAALVLLLLVSHAQVARSESALEREQALKAACLFNFCQFITWPASAFDAPSSPIVIGVLGNDTFGGLLDEMVRGETVRGRAIRIQRFRRPEEAADCHIVFVSGSEAWRQGSVLRAVQNRSIVSVGESDEFLNSGGMIVLASVQNKVRLRINLPAVRAGGVSMSSKLLRLADIVQ